MGQTFSTTLQLLVLESSGHWAAKRASIYHVACPTESHQSKSRQCDRFRHEGETMESRYLVRSIYATMKDHGLYFAKYSKGLVLVKEKRKRKNPKWRDNFYTPQAGLALENPGRLQITNNSSLLGVFLWNIFLFSSYSSRGIILHLREGCYITARYVQFSFHTFSLLREWGLFLWLDST